MDLDADPKQVRKLTTVMAEALRSSDTVFTVNELVTALDALKIVALEMAKEKANG